MRYALAFLICMTLGAVPESIQAQHGDDNPSFSSSMGLSLSAPISPIRHYVSTGLGVDYSAGYNFTRRHAIVGEFMWNWLFSTDEALQPLRVALQTPNIDAHGNLFAVTVNYKFELRGKLLGAYLITGGGGYYRNASITKEIPTGTEINCQPVWLWWGYSCSEGLTTTSLTVAHASSGALGATAGVGFTIRVGEAPYRWYVETRYHYAPNRNIATQLVTTTIGFRY
jgi:hypothetical protein